MKHQTEFLRSADGTQLFMQSWLPPDRTPEVVVGLLHGWSDHSGRYSNVVERLLPEGFGVYGIDLRGHGKSDGQRGHVNRWDEYREDAHAFVTLLERRYPQTPVFLIGHSMGGLVLLEYAVHHPGRALAGMVVSSPLLSTPNVSPALRTVGQVLSRVMPRFSINPGTDDNTLSRDPKTTNEYAADPLVHQRVSARASTEMSQAQAFTLHNLDAARYPLLLIYGDADQLVPPHVSREVFADIGAADKTRHEYEGGYHELFNDIIKQQVLDDVLAWLRQHR